MPALGDQSLPRWFTRDTRPGNSGTRRAECGVMSFWVFLTQESSPLCVWLHAPHWPAHRWGNRRTSILWRFTCPKRPKWCYCFELFYEQGQGNRRQTLTYESSCTVQFKFWCHFSFGYISGLVTFQFSWCFFFGDIYFLVKLVLLVMSYFFWFLTFLYTIRVFLICLYYVLFLTFWTCTSTLCCFFCTFGNLCTFISYCFFSNFLYSIYFFYLIFLLNFF